MRALLDVKLHGAKSYSLYHVALFDDALELTEEGSFHTTIIELKPAHPVKIVAKHGVHYIVVEMALMMKMPNLNVATRWLEELRGTSTTTTEPAADMEVSESPASLADAFTFDVAPRLRTKAVPKRRIFSFPGSLYGVAKFEDSAADSAINTRSASVLTPKLSEV